MDEEAQQSPQLAGAPASSSERDTSYGSTTSFSEGPQPKSEATANPAGAIPNGGLQAWLHVLGGFMLFFNTWGLLNAFGVFQTYYESGALFSQSSSDISWIGAIQSFLVMFVGCVSGPIYDRGYLRALLLVGSFLVTFGLMMLSLATTYWEVLLAQGFCTGIGAGCLFVPCVAILPTYFNTKLGLVIGIAAAGSSLGGIIYPIVLFQLIDRVGFGWAVRVMGFIALATLIIPIAVMRMRVKAAKPRSLIDWSAFTDVSYMLFVFGSLLGFIGLYVLLFYLSFFAQDQNITDTKMAFYIVPIFNAASCFGRTIPNAVSDKTGTLNLIAPGATVVGILMFCMLAVKHEAAIIVIAVLGGFFSGVFIALPPVCFVALTKDKSKIGTRIGMGFAMIGLGVLIGGPGGGGVLGSADPLNWTGLWIFGGVTTVAAGLIYGVLRVSHAGFKLNVKV